MLYTVLVCTGVFAVRDNRQQESLHKVERYTSWVRSVKRIYVVHIMTRVRMVIAYYYKKRHVVNYIGIRMRHLSCQRDVSGNKPYQTTLKDTYRGYKFFCMFFHMYTTTSTS